MFVTLIDILIAARIFGLRRTDSRLVEQHNIRKSSSPNDESHSCHSTCIQFPINAQENWCIQLTSKSKIVKKKGLVPMTALPTSEGEFSAVWSL